MTDILTNWEPRHAALFGQHTVHLQHRAHESGLFSDDALANLIERSPREAYHVNTMDNRSHNPRSRREGEIAGLSGHEALEAVRAGNLWINIQRPGETEPAYQELLDGLYRELERRVPGLQTYKQKMTILISSPKVTVYYHSDIPGQTLWQVRGEKRIYLYPNTAPFLSQEAMEKIVLNEAHETDMPYEPWFDDYAQVVDLKPGEMLHWPLNCPHRVINADCLNVSFTTEHWTDELRNIYAVNFANGMLRKTLGLKSLSRATHGPAFLAKLALAGAVKAAGFQQRREAGFRIDFTVDPAAPDGIRDIAAYGLRK
ncbi:MAG: cupin-like domain-containing protein [Hyphomicrobiaceae bacterium]